MLTKLLKRHISAHAKDCYPAECCGLIVKIDGKKVYRRCKNIAKDNDQFYIDPQDVITAENMGELIAIVHSHPDGTPNPSEFDKAQMSLHELPWVIIAVDDKGATSFGVHTSSNYTAPLLGREYFHGVQDCYTLVKDYYERELGITLSDYERADGWWERGDSPSLYLDNFKKEGFIVVDDLQKHDAILCRVGDTLHVNHALIYIDDGKLTSERTPQTAVKNLVLHHPYGRLSTRELYGQLWQDRAVMVLRHRRFCRG